METLEKPAVAVPKRPTLDDLDMPTGKKSRLYRMMYEHGPGNGNKARIGNGNHNRVSTGPGSHNTATVGNGNYNRVVTGPGNHNKAQAGNGNHNRVSTGPGNGNKARVGNGNHNKVNTGPGRGNASGDQHEPIGSARLIRRCDGAELLLCTDGSDGAGHQRGYSRPARCRSGHRLDRAKEEPNRNGAKRRPSKLAIPSDVPTSRSRFFAWMIVRTLLCGRPSSTCHSCF